MAIEFRCGQCGRLLRTGDDTAGRMAQCPECGSQTPIPIASEAQEPETVDVEVLEPSAPYGNPFAKESGVSFRTSGNFDPYRKQALISFVLGIVSSMFFCCFPVDFFIALLGIVFGVLGLRSPTAKTVAVIGLGLSILGMFLSIMIFLFYLMAGIQNPQQPFHKINP
jgi:hypothetical protein